MTISVEKKHQIAVDHQDRQSRNNLPAAKKTLKNLLVPSCWYRRAIIKNQDLVPKNRLMYLQAFFVENAFYRRLQRCAESSGVCDADVGCIEAT